MAARPFLQAFRRYLKENGGWSAIFQRIADGETLTKIAKAYNCSDSWLCHQLRDDPKRRELYIAARKEAARALVDQAQDIVDDATVDRDALMKAKMQAEHRRWTAARYDREQFGETPNQQVAETVGNLLLDALRRRSVPSSTPVTAEIIPDEAKDTERKQLVPPVTGQCRLSSDS